MMMKQLKITFKKNTPSLIINRIKQIVNKWGSQSTIKKLSGQLSMMSDYQQSLFYDLYKWVKSWQILSLQNPKDLFKTEKFLLSISHIKFTDLKILKLQNTTIKNIQPLTWMNIPKLQELVIWGHQISSFHMLSKLKFPFLNSLKIELNCFSLNFSIISRMKLKNTLKEMLIELQESNESLSWMAKFEPQQIHMWLISQKRLQTKPRKLFQTQRFLEYYH